MASESVADVLAIENEPWAKDQHMPDQKTLIIVIGALIVAVGVLGYMLYEAKKEPTGLQINVGKEGIKIEQK